VRKIEKLANESFNENIKDALESLIKNKDPKLGEIVKELNKKEASFVFRKLHEYHVDKIIDETFGGKEQFAKDVMIELKLDELGMTKEDVANSEKNPFYKNVRNAAIKLCLSVILPLVVYMMIKASGNTAWILVVQGCLITYFASEMARSLMKCIKFKNIKQKI